MDSKVSVFFRSRESTIIGRQRLVFFLAVSVMSIVLTLSSFALHPKTPALTFVDISAVIITALLMFLYFKDKINIRLSITAVFILLQLELSAQQIPFAPIGNALILQASFLSLLLITLSLVCFLKYSPTIISVISIFTYMLCLTIDSNVVLRTFLPVYLVVLIGAILYDLFTIRAVMNMEVENTNLRQEIMEFFYATGLDEESMSDIARISRESGKSEGMRELLSRMDPSIRARLVGGLSAIRQEEDASRKSIMAAFPMLTPAQVTICQLILQDKKLAEICKITGKSEGNITSQRSRIRSILELGPDDVLKDVLSERLKSYLEASSN